MTAADLHIAGLSVPLAWWYMQVLAAYEWWGHHQDRLEVPERRLTSMEWAYSWLIARTMRLPILWGGIASGLGLLLVALQRPWTVVAADLLLLALYVWRLRRWRVQRRWVDPVRHLRAALVDVQGPDAEVHTIGRLSDGGPERITIVPGEGWRHWRDTAQAELGAAIAATLPGSWECIEHRPDGVTVWQRAPELPERVDYPGPGEVRDWRVAPVGVDGYGQVVSVDFGAAPHWLLAGTTGSGKTSYLRVIGTHLLAANVQVIALDPNRVGLSFLERRPGVTCAIGEHTADGQYKAIAAQLTRLVETMSTRLVELEQTRKRPKPLVILVDEVEAFLEDAKRNKSRGKDAKENKDRALSDLMQLARQGRKVAMHLVLATQRPDATAMPTALRDLCVGRIAVGRLSEQGAKMMLGTDLEAGQRTLGVKGRAVLRAGSVLTPVQGYWMPDPDDMDASKAERQAAEQWLPPVSDEPATESDVHVHVHPEAPIESPAAADVHRACPDAPAPARTPAPADEGTDERTDERAPAARALAAVRTLTPARRETVHRRNYRANLRRDLAADPNDPRHGRPAAIQAGCTCRRCRPDYASTSA